MSSYWAPYGWLPGGVAERVRLVAEDGRWTRVEAGVEPADQDVRLPGLVLPGFANTHSHAFHRALRGRTHGDGGTFWTWRDRMYALARRLEPPAYHLLARAVYAEMALAGISAVGEFHYLHHQQDGSPYPDPNAFGHALIQAASEAGIRITLLDTCYLSGGLGPAGHLELDEVQRRFSDGSAAAWQQRVALLAQIHGAQVGAAQDDTVRIGAAIHSVRAVPAGQLGQVVAAAAGSPLHVHVSEQPAENEATLGHYGCSPTELLARHGFGGPLHTAVHATHLSAADIALYGRTATNISFCPTTERDLADGIGPAPELAAAGARLTLGSDQNACVDLLEEARALELHARLASLRRGRFSPAELVDALTGHASLGWPDAGQLAPGQRADLVALRLDTVRTAGALPEQVVLVAGAADVDTVLVDGRLVVSGGRHVLGDVAGLLAEAIAPLWR
ncbi:MAG TPA: formimidoylglutamate deiminase [Jatrophihabitans sp.]|jgi:formiminoglutamate deiminase|uniref:formimidoylglutamate deiminase n=1 Tax=Jatrophihabitans sp. TaxID=1932789 RepID=UPI002F19B7D7